MATVRAFLSGQRRCSENRCLGGVGDWARPWVGRADRVAFDRDPVAQLEGGNNDGRVHRITIDFSHDASRCAAVSHVTTHT